MKLNFLSGNDTIVDQHAAWARQGRRRLQRRSQVRPHTAGKQDCAQPEKRSDSQHTMKRMRAKAIANKGQTIPAS